MPEHQVPLIRWEYTMTTRTETNREVLEALLVGGFKAPEVEYEARADDFVAHIPQSGERIEGRDALRSMQEGLGGPPRMELRRLTGDGDLFVVETTQTYEDGTEYFVCVIVEFTDGRIARETRYYGPPLP